jgi:hypothetical protein
MRALIAMLTLITVIGCSIIGRPSVDDHADENAMFSGVPMDELNQEPQIAEIPDHGGWMTGFHFSVDLTEQQEAYLLGGIIGVFRMSGGKTDGSVMIFLYDGKTQSASVTADFATNIVEFWSTVDRETYTKRTYEGDPDKVLAYLSDGTCGNPKIETGRIADEVKVILSKKVTL